MGNKFPNISLLAKTLSGYLLPASLFCSALKLLC